AARTERKSLGDDVRRKLVFDAADLVAKDELPLLQSLYLNEVGTGRGDQGRYRRVEVAVFLQQARQLLPQRAFFLVSHCHRWYFFASAAVSASALQLLRFPQARSSVRKIDADQRFAPVCRSAGEGVPSILR